MIMNRIIYIIIGIVIFILILCSSFINLSSGKFENNVDNTQGNVDSNQQSTEKIDDIVYKGKFSLVDRVCYTYAIKATKKELDQAVEGMYHNLNTLICRATIQ